MATYFFNAKVGKQNMAVPHFNYIFREQKYSVREDLLYCDWDNLPDWAEDDPSKFWNAVQEFEKKTPYREYVIALPEELPLKENIKMIQELIEKDLENKQPYSFAIHSVPSSIEKGHINVHAHIMFSERMLEPDRKISKEEFFKRHSKKRNGTICGGAKKNRKYSDKILQKKHLLEMRKFYADLQNKYYEKNKIDARVDHRSLKEISKELSNKGELIDAELKNRPVRTRLPVAVVKNPKFTQQLEDGSMDDINDEIANNRQVLLTKRQKINLWKKYKGTPDILVIHAKEFLIKQNIQLKNRYKENKKEIDQLKKKVVYDNAIDTVVRNKLTQGKYGKVKKEYKSLQEKINWIEEKKKDKNYFPELKDFEYERKFKKILEEKSELENQYKEGVSQFDNLKNQIVEQNKKYDPQLQQLQKQNYRIEKQLKENEITLQELSKRKDDEILLVKGRTTQGRKNISLGQKLTWRHSSESIANLMESLVENPTIQLNVQKRMDQEDWRQEQRESKDTGLGI